jgi:hypothetical protein
VLECGCTHDLANPYVNVDPLCGRALRKCLTACLTTELRIDLRERAAFATLMDMTFKIKNLPNVDSGGALSSAVEHYLHTVGVAGSNPAARTIPPLLPDRDSVWQKATFPRYFQWFPHPMRQADI